MLPNPKSKLQELISHGKRMNDRAFFPLFWDYGKRKRPWHCSDKMHVLLTNVE